MFDIKYTGNVCLPRDAWTKCTDCDHYDTATDSVVLDGWMQQGPQVMNMYSVRLCCQVTNLVQDLDFRC